MEALEKYLETLIHLGHNIKVKSTPTKGVLVKFATISLKGGGDEFSAREIVSRLLLFPPIKEAYYTHIMSKNYGSKDYVVEFIASQDLSREEGEGQAKGKSSVFKDNETEMRIPTEKDTVRQDLVSPGAGIGYVNTRYSGKIKKVKTIIKEKFNCNECGYIFTECICKKIQSNISEGAMKNLATQIEEWISIGLSDSDIIKKISEEYKMSIEEARKLLKSYDNHMEDLEMRFAPLTRFSVKGKEKKEVYGLPGGHLPQLNKERKIGESKNLVDSRKYNCTECGFKLYECKCINENWTSADDNAVSSDNLARQADEMVAKGLTLKNIEKLMTPELERAGENIQTFMADIYARRELGLRRGSSGGIRSDFYDEYKKLIHIYKNGHIMESKKMPKSKILEYLDNNEKPLKWYVGDKVRVNQNMQGGGQLMTVKEKASSADIWTLTDKTGKGHYYHGSDFQLVKKSDDRPRNESISESQEYGVRWKEFAGKEGRLITKEKFFDTKEQLDKFTAKIEKGGNFYEFDSWLSPKPKNEDIDSNLIIKWIPASPSDRASVLRIYNGDIPKEILTAYIETDDGKKIFYYKIDGIKYRESENGDFLIKEEFNKDIYTIINKYPAVKNSAGKEVVLSFAKAIEKEFKPLNLDTPSKFDHADAASLADKFLKNMDWELVGQTAGVSNLREELIKAMNDVIRGAFYYNEGKINENYKVGDKVILRKRVSIRGNIIDAETKAKITGIVKDYNSRRLQWDEPGERDYEVKTKQGLTFNVWDSDIRYDNNCDEVKSFKNEEHRAFKAGDPVEVLNISKVGTVIRAYVPNWNYMEVKLRKFGEIVKSADNNLRLLTPDEAKKEGLPIGISEDYVEFRSAKDNKLKKSIGMNGFDKVLATKEAIKLAQQHNQDINVVKYENDDESENKKPLFTATIDGKINEAKVRNEAIYGDVADIMGSRPKWYVGGKSKDESDTIESFKRKIDSFKKKEIISQGEMITELEPELEELKRKAMQMAAKAKTEGDEEGVEQFKKWKDDLDTIGDEVKSLKTENRENDFSIGDKVGTPWGRGTINKVLSDGRISVLYEKGYLRHYGLAGDFMIFSPPFTDVNQHIYKINEGYSDNENFEVVLLNEEKLIVGDYVQLKEEPYDEGEVVKVNDNGMRISVKFGPDDIVEYPSSKLLKLNNSTESRKNEDISNQFDAMKDSVYKDFEQIVINLGGKLANYRSSIGTTINIRIDAPKGMEFDKFIEEINKKLSGAKVVAAGNIKQRENNIKYGDVDIRVTIGESKIYEDIEGLKNFVTNIKPLMLKVKRGENISPDEMERIKQFVIESSTLLAPKLNNFARSALSMIKEMERSKNNIGPNRWSEIANEILQYYLETMANINENKILENNDEDVYIIKAQVFGGITGHRESFVKGGDNKIAVFKDKESARKYIDKHFKDYGKNSAASFNYSIIQTKLSKFDNNEYIFVNESRLNENFIRGQRIKAISDYTKYGIKIGMEGTITNIKNSNKDRPLLVAFDDLYHSKDDWTFIWMKPEDLVQIPGKVDVRVAEYLRNNNESKEKQIILKKDGIEKGKYDSINDALADLHRKASCSLDHAFKHEGWTLEGLDGNIVLGNGQSISKSKEDVVYGSQRIMGLGPGAKGKSRAGGDAISLIGNANSPMREAKNKEKFPLDEYDDPTNCKFCNKKLTNNPYLKEYCNKNCHDKDYYDKTNRMAANDARFERDVGWGVYGRDESKINSDTKFEGKISERMEINAGDSILIGTVMGKYKVVVKSIKGNMASVIVTTPEGVSNKNTIPLKSLQHDLDNDIAQKVSEDTSDNWSVINDVETIDKKLEDYKDSIEEIEKSIKDIEKDKGNSKDAKNLLVKTKDEYNKLKLYKIGLKENKDEKSGIFEYIKDLEGYGKEEKIDKIINHFNLSKEEAENIYKEYKILGEDSKNFIKLKPGMKFKQIKNGDIWKIEDMQGGSMTLSVFKSKEWAGTVKASVSDWEKAIEDGLAEIVGG